MNTPSLNEIDRLRRRQIESQPREYSKSKARKIFLLTLVSTPFALVEFMFVPMLGQLLGFLVVFLALYYLKLERSWRYLGAMLLGAALALILVILIGPLLDVGVIFVLYGMLALATLFMLALAGFITAQIWKHYNPSKNLT